ncbi:MAG: hypothetical protein WDN09_01540 [bacterium]
MKKILWMLLLLLLVATIATVLYKQRQFEAVPDPEQADTAAGTAASVDLADGAYCFSRTQKASDAEPYSVEEHIALRVAGSAVTGTKEGMQAGPGMTNGYTGTLSGTRTGNSIVAIYAYTVEGSQNKEQEEYEFKNDSLVKSRYALVEKDKMLVPDKTSEPKLVAYAEEECK